ncbi:MAG: hypothetical protein HGB32_02560 [Geobacteraceae bacterium]|nr:hypothetical protein [Geobacteraceae bacterium]NTW79015.1 hypothetical protein [Geobacteraceae bacterium]
MRILRLLFVVVVMALSSSFVMGAGSVNVFNGMIRNIKGPDMVVILKNGSEKQLKIDKDTRIFIGSERSPYSFIKPNSMVEVSINSDGKCLQVVVQEGPK